MRRTKMVQFRFLIASVLVEAFGIKELSRIEASRWRLICNRGVHILLIATLFLENMVSIIFG